MSWVWRDLEVGYCVQFICVDPNWVREHSCPKLANFTDLLKECCFEFESGIGGVDVLSG
jgi:hypothetical protein